MLGILVAGLPCLLVILVSLHIVKPHSMSQLYQDTLSKPKIFSMTHTKEEGLVGRTVKNERV